MKKKLKKKAGKKKIKNGPKVLKKAEVVDGKGVDRPIPSVPMDKEALRWKKYDEEDSTGEEKRWKIFFSDRGD